MTKIALLACGPSLKEFWSVSKMADYELVIGVNTAGWLFPVDWLAFSDTHIITPMREGKYPHPFHGYITNGGQKIPGNLERRPLPLYQRNYPALTPELQALATAQGMTECGYTFPNALCVAQTWSGGEPIHVYGFDCAMQRHDAAGQEGYHTRKRWLTELPWIKSQWGKNVTAFSRANPTIIAWLEGRATWEDVRKLFPKEPSTLDAIVPGVPEPVCKTEP